MKQISHSTPSIGWHIDINDLPLSRAQQQQIKLLTASSLTNYLEQDQKEVKAQIIHLGSVELGHIECDTKRISPPYFQREIFLCAGKAPKIWAESLCSSTSLFWRKFLNCGQTPLGKNLFNGELPIQRSVIRYTLLDRTQVPKCLFGFLNKAKTTLVARQSCFSLNNETLSLTEIFLE